MKNTLSLKQVLLREDIKENLLTNLFVNKTELELAIEKTIEDKKENSISIEINRGEDTLVFENALHVDNSKRIYLLESRLFDKEKDQMLNAYLEIIKMDGTIIQECIDDVWSYANWEII
ncbi:MULTISPECIES: hypothetical protein [unclassified Clostridium]|uniref:hypothetical protein n=1 Tax=unclassified Clostridium TaxID=2614128 RepID=UPI0025BF8CD6|nr:MULTISPECIES: hypothetical protein [unclassified Clostridium]